MRKQLLTTLCMVFTGLCYGQTDTIYSNNEKIPCTVVEITPDAVKFKYPNEELVNSIYKNTVQKISYKSGRTQTFAEATSFKTINGVEDFDNVTATQVESEVKGLFKIGDVSSKAVGTTNLANQERVKERAYRKIKINAAMMGANIIYITNQRTEGNKAGTQYQAGQAAEVNLSGVAYSNQLPSFDEFKTRAGGKTTFSCTEEIKMWSSASDYTKKPVQLSLKINDITNENGIIKLHAALEKEKKITDFRVVSFDAESFHIYYEDKSTMYNIKVSFN